MSNEKAIPPRPDKKKMQTTQEIFHNLLEIVELYPQYSITQHFHTITRRKSDTEKEFYYWNEEFFLKRIQQHKDELEGDSLMNIDEEEF
jgi:hypothetical protein